MSTIKRITATLFTLLMLWGAFYLFRIISEVPNNNNLNYVPKDSQFVARIDGRQLFEKGIKSIILEEDQEVIRLIDEIFDRKTEDQETGTLGIIFHSDIVFFQKVIKDEKVHGLLFNLANSKKFQKNIASLLNENQSFAHRNNVGIILSLSNEKTNSITAQDLQIQADQMLSTESSFEKQRIELKQNEVFTSWSNIGFLEDGEIITKSSISLELEDKEISLSGTLDIENHEQSKKNKRLKPNNTHLTSRVVSKVVNDSINGFFEDLNIAPLNITAISMNYSGTEIVEEPSFFIVPQVDLLIETNEDYNIQLALDSAALIEEDIVLSDGFFKYGGNKFYYQQVDSRLIYIGVTKNPTIENISTDILFDISGPLSPLTTLHGKGMMRRFLELIPLYSACKDLALKINELNVKVEKESSGKANVNGKVFFKEENYALNALIHFAIEGHLIK